MRIYTLVPDILGAFNQYKLSLDGRSFFIEAERKDYREANLTLSFVEIRGIMSSVSGVTVNNVGWDTFTFNSKVSYIKLLKFIS